MTAAATAGWMGRERRALVAHVEDLIANLGKDRSWCIERFGELIQTGGSGQAAAEVLACSVAGHFTRSNAAFDIALDCFNAARNPALSNANVRKMIFAPAQTEALDDFHAESIALTWRITELRQRHPGGIA